MADAKTVEFRFTDQGIVSKLTPDLLRDGQYRKLINTECVQEGALSSRAGSAFLGSLGNSVKTAYHIAKLTLDPGENPLVPATNPRYIATQDSSFHHNIERTTNYNGSVTAASQVESSALPHWEMAAYHAGSSGDPWGYFACPKAMLKDRGRTPYTPLAPWGILPAYGVATAVAVIGNVSVTAGAATTPVVVTLASPAGVSVNQKVTFTGIGIVTDGHVYAALPLDSLNIQLFYDEDADPGLAGQPVVPVGAFTGGGTLNSVATSGNLDGGAESSPNNTQAYDWRFTYVDGDTGNEGNPSQVMLTGSPVTGGAPLAIHNGQATVTVWGTDNSRITKIALYRRGGILFDTWRRVAFIANPGWNGGTNLPNSATYVDNIADADLQYEPQIETDNDPPVTSLPASPLITSISDVSVGPGQITVNLTAGSAFTGKLTRGTQASIAGVNGESPETCTIEWVGSGSVNLYLQFGHSAGDVFTVDAITNQPCHLATAYAPGDCVIVAGDPNNPHTAYKSKNGMPESFPVGTDAAGAVTQVNAGTPSNPIVNLCEFRGSVLFLNLNSLFESVVIQGSLSTPIEVAFKGLVSQSAWCKTPGEVWFLSTDGIWSWDGNQIRKRSLAIDPIFHNKTINGLNPLNLNGAPPKLQYRRGKIYFFYSALPSGLQILVCEIADAGDRWDLYSPNIGSLGQSVSVLFQEADTDNLIIGWSGIGGGPTFGLADQVVGPSNYTSDLYAGDPTVSGGPIAYDIWLPWFDMGAPQTTKLFGEVLLECDPELATAFPGAALTIELLLNYSDVAVDTITVNIPLGGTTLAGRTLISLLPQVVSRAGTLEAFGREATAISYHIYGQAYPVQASFYRLLMTYQETGMLTAGSTKDWDQLGHPYDKRLYQMTVVFDTAGINQTLLLDVIKGLGAGAYSEADASRTFFLNNPVIIGNGRAMQTFAMPDGTIVKQVRLRQASTQAGAGQAATTFFRVHSVTFPEQENYPADLTTNTPWEDGGYEYDKYANQIDIEADTNNQPVDVQIQADGATVETVTMQSTNSDRRRNFTLKTGLKGKKWRLYVDPTQISISLNGGKFQKFSHAFKFQQADKGEVGHTFDWDDLGHPWDKQLLNVTIDYDTTIGGPVTLQMDTLSGIGGVTVTPNVAQFVLGLGRGSTNYPLPPDTVVKKIRIYPIGAVPVGYKQWKYNVDKILYPADFVRTTAWKDASAPVDKEPSWLWVDADTSNVAAIGQLQNEIGNALAFTHSGVANNRKKNYAIAADTRAKMWRIIAQEGVNGRFQLFDWGFERWQPFPLSGPIDPPEIILCTPWSDFAYPYPKMARDLILTINTGGVPCGIALQTSEAGTVTTFPNVATTNAGRRVVLSCPPNLQGTLWRLVFTPGQGGLSQLWDWALDAVKMPPLLTTWSSYGQGFGYKGFHFLGQFWLDYLCAGAVNVTFTSDTGVLTFQLPAHPARGVERELLPSVWGAGLGKSKLYGLKIDSVNPAMPFQAFADLSGVEWLPLGADRHAGYQQAVLSSFMGVAI